MNIIRCGVTASPKGGTAFLHGSRMDMGLDEALKPMRDPDVLRNSTPEQFAEDAGQVMAELNYVHPFREGNGRGQEVSLPSLGDTTAIKSIFTVLTKPRIVEASIETTRQAPP
ncbi:Fic family protein [Mesorhizobium sp.]|uniref:Fic family protein n=1 Tax=Mesorhizobium sp. TaxID=1871066 RepID=UPI00257D03AA|nr:Fic family protein [Mesorhizobium sp.]